MKLKQRLERFVLRFALAFAALLLLCGAARADGLTVHFLDVDRNDGIVITCDGEAAFIDGGVHSYSEWAVEYMQSIGIGHIKYYIGTHAHKDHVAGGARVILAMTPDSVLQPHDGVQELIIREARGEEELAAARGARYVTVAVGQTYAIGGAKLTVIGPPSVTKYQKYTSLENFNSMIFRLSYGANSFLFTGDTSSTILNRLEQASPGTLKCDVLKNPHHNGATKASVLNACAPQFVVYSTSDKHQPTSAALRDAANAGARTLITSPRQNGTVILHSDGRNLSCTVSNGPTEITLSKSELSIYEGKRQAVSARVTPRHYRTVSFVSLDPAIAQVDSSGRVTGVSPGTATVRALASNGLYADCTVTVMPVGVKLNRTALSIRHGGTGTLKATLLPSGTRGHTVSWSSDDPSIATVTSNGRFTGHAPGETVIRATLENGSQAACVLTVNPVRVSSVKINPSRLTLALDQTKQLAATVSPKNATYPDVAWSSADESIARVDKNGLLTAVGMGRTTITATADGRERTMAVTVTPVYITSIALSIDRPSLTAGVAGRNTLQVSAAIQPLNATIQDIAWKTSNPRVATVDENGVVTAVSPGRANIFAVSQDGSRRQTSIRVTVEANQFVRKAAVVVPGQLTVSAKRLVYERDDLRVELYYANQTDQPVPLPAGGVLTLILPDGKELPVGPVEPGQRALRGGRVGAWTVRLPLAGNPRLAGLDLAACDATVR